MSKIKMTIYVDPATRKHAKVMAASKGQTMSDFVEGLILGFYQAYTGASYIHTINTSSIDIEADESEFRGG